MFAPIRLLLFFLVSVTSADIITSESAGYHQLVANNVFVWQVMVGFLHFCSSLHYINYTRDIQLWKQHREIQNPMPEPFVVEFFFSDRRDSRGTFREHI